MAKDDQSYLNKERYRRFPETEKGCRSVRT